MTLADLWLEALGRFHPVLLHFPLALTAAAMLVEGWAWIRRRTGPTPAATSMLIIAAISAPFSAWSGWLNAAFGGDAGETLEWHRRTGVISAVAIVLAAIAALALSRPSAGPPRRGALTAFRAWLILSAVVVGYCGHLGGQLKWGSDYTTEVLFRALRATLGGGVTDDGSSARRGPELPRGAAGEGGSTTGDGARAGAGGRAVDLEVPEQVFFDEHVRALFAAHCSECHLGGRRKGGLFLGDRSMVVRQDDDGVWIVREGSADESELLRRVELPEGDLDAMPPDGPRLSATELALLRRWVEQGAR